MTATITWQPHIDIPTPSLFKIYRKADTDTPVESYLVDDWTLLFTTSDALEPYSHTDATGNKDYLYTVQTQDSDGNTSPLAHIIPGHNRSSFCKLIAGQGYLSNLLTGSAGLKELWHEEHEATSYIIDEYLRSRFSLAQIWAYYDVPPPKIRDMTALWGSMAMTAKLRPGDDDLWEKLKDRFDKLASGFAMKGDVLTYDLEKVDQGNTDPVSEGWNWQR